MRIDAFSRKTPPVLSSLCADSALTRERHPSEDMADVSWDLGPASSGGGGGGGGGLAKSVEVEHFAVSNSKYVAIKTACKALSLPLSEEYDYKNDRRPLNGHRLSERDPTPWR